MLNKNPDILFRIYRKGKLHVLLFRPTNDSWWITTLRDQYPGIFSQWTFQHADNQPIRHVMNLAGKKDLLERFCKMFLANRARALAHLEEVQELSATIQDLRLENRILRRTIKEGQP
ncbi:hypothetical protein PO909_031803 [Leuciscus waleckii]